jgi:tRNA-2-methylthio-N6-dimethylallyladenosine synthase
MNKLDSVLVGSALQEGGFRLVEDVADADVVLLNTCSVREHAEQRVFSHLGHLKHVKQERPCLVVGVIGCMAQRLGAELLEDGVVDIVCGPAQIPQLKKLIDQALEQKNRISRGVSHSGVISVSEKVRQKADGEQENALDEFEGAYDRAEEQVPAQAYVRVMHGCNNFCSFCVVPYVRGREISRRPSAIAEQVKRLAGEGIKCVTLLGQRVNAYEYVTDGKTYCLADVLMMVSEVAGIEWIRFVTSYPAEKFYDQILAAMAELPKVCRYLHIPAQSGSDKILAAMNRKYTAREYLEMLERAREKVAGIAISGDFIVGFPGETEEDFKASVSLLEKARYKNAFIFKYSPRPGTAALKGLQDTVPQDVKKKRNMELLAVQEKISGELAAGFVGKEVKVLVEGPSKKSHARSCDDEDCVQLAGRTAEDWIVVFDGPKILAGEFVKLKIARSSPLTLFGEIA